MRFNKRNKTIFNMKTKDKLSNKDIAEHMGISVARVSQILKDEYKRNNYLPPTDKARKDLQEIIAMYNGNVHPKEIAAMYSVSDRFIRMLLEDVGVYRTRKKAFPKSVEHTALDDFTPKSEYFMGFVLGSGKFDAQDSSILIEHIDKDSLMRLSTIVSQKGRASNKVVKSDKGYQLKITSKSIYNRLVSNGIIKSNVTYGSSPTGDLLRSSNFWRGYIDATGRIGFDKNGKPFITVTAHNNFIKEGMILFLGNVVDLGFDIKSEIWKLTMTEKYLLLKFIELVYLNAPKEIRLARNYERALLIYESLT